MAQAVCSCLKRFAVQCEIHFWHPNTKVTGAKEQPQAGADSTYTQQPITWKAEPLLFQVTVLLCIFSGNKVHFNTEFFSQLYIIFVL